MATAGLPLWSTTAASNATADPAVNWAEGMAPSAVNDSARAQMASVAKWRDDLYGITSGLTTGGTTTAFTVTTNATYATAAVMSGAIFTIVMNATSGAAPTLAVDGLTARALNVSTGVAVPTGALISGTPYLVRYVHATTEFIVLNPSIRPNTGLDIIGGTQLTAPANNDTLPIYDLSATANRRILLSDFFTVINDFTADSSPDQTADYVVTYDASAALPKKVLLQNINGRNFPIPALYKNLVIKVATNTTVTVAADFVTTTDGTAFQTTAVSGTIDLGTNGAVNRLDAGTIAAATWYAIWVIAKADGTTGALASTSATAPTLPTGYTYKARVGWVRTQAGGATLLGSWQLGNRAQYVVGLAACSAYPTIGTTSGTSFNTFALGAFVPTTAGVLQFFGGSSSNGSAAISPNNSTSATSATSNPSPHTFAGPTITGHGGSILLESTNIYAAISSGTLSVFAVGWEDNI